MDRNLFIHCMVCGRKNDNTSHNYSGFHVHEKCHASIRDLDMAIFTSATVITCKDRALDDRWFCVSGEHAPGHFTIRVYDSTEGYITNNVACVVELASYVSAISYIVAQFQKG